MDLDYILPFTAIASTINRNLHIVSCSRRCQGQESQPSFCYTCPTQVIFPLFPNHGLFGNDGLYTPSQKYRSRHYSMAGVLKAGARIFDGCFERGCSRTGELRCSHILCEGDGVQYPGPYASSFVQHHSSRAYLGRPQRRNGRRAFVLIKRASFVAQFPGTMVQTLKFTNGLEAPRANFRPDFPALEAYKYLADIRHGRLGQGYCHHRIR